ncbi:hypothetical protein CK228_31200 [Mesorhizobium sp. WSM4312]|nr:hypothetical protein CK228_31200 [Mesorhizobium sp. WSM4312]
MAGLVPRQITTGGKPCLTGTSKRGSTYMRVLLIHGARAALPSLAEWTRSSAPGYKRCTARQAQRGGGCARPQAGPDRLGRDVTPAPIRSRDGLKGVMSLVERSRPGFCSAA